MAVVWIIEKPSTDGSSLANILMGSFAVKPIASFPSYKFHRRVNKNSKPDILLVDTEPYSLSDKNLETYFSEQMQNVTKVFLGEQKNYLKLDKIHFSAYKKFFYLHKSVTGLELVKSLNVIASCREKSFCEANKNEYLHYKDLRLDSDSFAVRVMPDEESMLLSRKEAQILKFFMNNPGNCLSRYEIKDAVWNKVAVSMRSIDSHISRLRKKIEGSEAYIESVYGGGYIMK